MTIHQSSREELKRNRARGPLVDAVLGFDIALGPAPDGNTRLWLSRFVNTAREAWAALELHIADGQSTGVPADADATVAQLFEAHNNEHEEIRKRLQDLIRDAMAVDPKEPSQLSGLRLRGIHMRELLWAHQTRTSELVFEAGWREIGGEGG